MIFQVQRLLLRWIFLLFSGTALLPQFTTGARAWSNDVFEQYLAAGKWSVSADDNEAGETLPLALVETIVRRYCETPTDRDALENIGILALTVGAANWGISDPAQLPPDPNKKSWASTTGADAGKHVMSYAIGGVGISHADVGDLREFLHRLAQRLGLPADQKVGLVRLADTVHYKKKNVVVYDELRAAGVCSMQTFDSDLNGVKFEHRPQSASKSYCQARYNASLGPSDWRLFRTVVRDALRLKEDQAWLLAFWMNHYWNDSLTQVKPGAGYIEEVIVNSRIRNSTPLVANKAVAPTETSPAKRVEIELKAYGDWNPATLERRRGTMLRPVVLYQALSEKLKKAGVSCP
ncbi:MAG: hypothetical protein QOD09_3627 [Bradyrhizobium sp.]|jgi:hypothetical protein|nr:hypothetical protein [Bradyrhizobium sp.]